MAPLSRRDFLSRSSASLAALTAGGSLARAASPFKAGDLPRPDQSGIEHIIVLMMENRSFDHLLGSDGQQAGLTYFDSAGAAFATHPLAPD